jgi:hypothetical protein
MSILATKELADCEATIERGMKSFVEVGNALAKIRADKLYHIDRGGEYETFEQYVGARWGWDRRRAYQLMDAAGVVDDVNNCSHAIPENEGQARELVKLEEPEERRAAWKEAVETAPNGKVTAAHVREVVNKKTGEVIDPADIEVVKVKDLGPTPQQRSHDDPARQWYEVLHRVLVVLNSIRDHGGIKKLSARWGKAEKQSNIAEMRRIASRLEECANELE